MTFIKMKNKKGLVPRAEKCLLFKSDYLRLVKIGPTLFSFFVCFFIERRTRLFKKFL